MPIRVVCKHCGKQFSAWDDLIGKAVKCPKCQQQMVVQSGNDALGEAKPPPSAPPTHPVASPPAAGTPAPTRPVPRPMPTTSALPAPRVTTSNQASAADDFDDSDDLPYSCPHCHQSMPSDEDLCDHCGYHRVLKRRIDIGDGIDKPDKSVGFERLFKGQLADTDSAQSTLLLIKVIGGLMALAFLFVCHPWSWLVAIAIGVGFFIYRSKRRSATAGDSDSSAVNQDIASSFIWTSTLNLQRAVGWRLPAWPFPTTKALTLHDSTFTDQDLSDVEDLATYETLDLEGTQLSNAGLQRLEKMGQLRYIVVRRTNVTVTGVQRLQQALPKACIWF